MPQYAMKYSLVLFTSILMISAGASMAQGPRMQDTPGFDPTWRSMSISGDRAVIGNHAYDNSSTRWRLGQVSIHRRTASGWAYRLYFIPDGAHSWSGTGFAVALHDSRMAISAPNFGGTDTIPGTGAVFIAEELAGFDVWATAARLESVDPEPGSKFGAAIGLGPNFLVVGSPGRSDSLGAVHLFVRQANEWTEVQTFREDGTALFGHSISMYDNRVVIGADHLSTTDTTQSGRVFVYTFAENALHLETELIPPDDMPWNGFGHSVAIHGDRIAVGSPFADIEYDPNYPYNGSTAGVVHVFELSNGAWGHSQMLKDNFPTTGDQFGWVVALHADRLMVGVPGGDDANPDRGLVQFFGVTDGRFVEQERIVPDPGNPAGRFGRFAAIDATGYMTGPNPMMMGVFPIGVDVAPELVDTERSSLEVHPNPTSSTFTLTMRPGTSRLYVYDLLGRRVHEAIVTGAHHTWTPTRLPAGTYVIVVRQGSSIDQKMVVYRP